MGGRDPKKVENHWHTEQGNKLNAYTCCTNIYTELMIQVKILCSRSRPICYTQLGYKCIITILRISIVINRGMDNDGHSMVLFISHQFAANIYDLKIEFYKNINFYFKTNLTKQQGRIHKNKNVIIITIYISVQLKTSKILNKSNLLCVLDY